METPTEWEEQEWDKPRKAKGRFLDAVPPTSSEKLATICKFQHQKAGCKHGHWCNYLHDHRWRKCFMESKRPGNCRQGEACRFSHAVQSWSPVRSSQRGRSPAEASQSSKAEDKEEDPGPVEVQAIVMEAKAEPGSEEPAPPPSSKPRPGEAPTAPEVPAPPAHREIARAAVLGSAKSSDLRALAKPRKIERKQDGAAASSSRTQTMMSNIIMDTIVQGMVGNPSAATVKQEPEEK